MLVPVLFIVAFMLALTGALLENSARSASTTWHAAVGRSADVAIADGVADFTHGLATFVARHGAAGPWPRGTSTSAARSTCSSMPDGGSCPLHYIISATITGASQTNATGTPVGRPALDDSALNLQAAVIDEQRVSAIVTVTLANGSETVGTRTRYLTYRVFETAPYAVVSGSRDITAVNGSRSAAQGDSGGAAESGGAGESGAVANDTRIHVRLTCRTRIANVVPFRNDQQFPGNDGLPWGNAAGNAYETPCATPDAPVDDFESERWTNGDTNPSGWTQ